MGSFAPFPSISRRTLYTLVVGLLRKLRSGIATRCAPTLRAGLGARKRPREFSKASVSVLLPSMAMLAPIRSWRAEVL